MTKLFFGGKILCSEKAEYEQRAQESYNVSKIEF
jgi:hypothetical protein